MLIKTIIIIIFCLTFLYGIILDLIGLRSVNNPIPENVQDVYDSEGYRKWQAYYKERTRLSMISDIVSFSVELALLLFNLYAAFAGLFPDTPWFQMLAVLLLSACSGIVELPFSWYGTMGIEEKYGFNRTGKKTFWADRVKGFFIGLALILAIGSVLLWLHQALGVWLIIAFAVVMTLAALFIAFLYPVLRRVFNKFTPLEDEELNAKLTALLEKHNYKVRAIQVMDASRRSTKANAYFSGFGKMKTIVLYDTLLETMDTEEIAAIFAHEMGHGLHRDTLKNQLLSFVQILILGVLAWLTLSVAGLYPPFGFGTVNYGFALILISSVEFALLSPLFALVTNAISRKAEYRADQQAVKEGYGEVLISALKKLARRDFSHIAPDPLLVKLYYSHPTLSQRIDAIRNEER